MLVILSYRTIISHMEKAVDFCFRKGKAVGETKPTERGDSTTNICLLFSDICKKGHKKSTV